MWVKSHLNLTQWQFSITITIYLIGVLLSIPLWHCQSLKCNPVKRKQKSYCQTAPFRILQVKTNDSASRLQNSSNPLRMRKKLIVHLKVDIIRNTSGVLVQKRAHPLAVWLPTINGPILILYSTFIRRVFKHIYILHWNACYLISMYIDAPMEHLKVMLQWSINANRSRISILRKDIWHADWNRQGSNHQPPN